MNLVLDDAEEIHSKTKSRKQLGKNIDAFWNCRNVCSAVELNDLQLSSCLRLVCIEKLLLGE